MLPEVDGADKRIRVTFWDLHEPRTVLHGVETWLTLPSTDYPLTAQHLSSLRIQWWSFEAKYPWDCFQVSTAWPNPHPDVLNEILCKKVRMAGESDLSSAALWLLIGLEQERRSWSLQIPRMSGGRRSASRTVRIML